MNMPRRSRRSGKKVEFLRKRIQSLDKGRVSCVFYSFKESFVPSDLYFLDIRGCWTCMSTLF